MHPPLRPRPTPAPQRSRHAGRPPPPARQLARNLHEIVIVQVGVGPVIRVGAAGLGLVFDPRKHVLLQEVAAVAQETANTPKPLAELRPFLAAVRDKLELAPKLCVVAREPFDQLHLVDHLLLAPVLLIAVPLGVLGLRRRQHNHLLYALGVHALDCHADVVQVLPHQQEVHGAAVEALERVIDPETILASVLRDLVKVLLDDLLLVHKLDVPQRLGGELNRLVEAVLPAVGHVDDKDDLGGEALVEALGLEEHVFEVRRTGEHKALHVDLIVRHENLLGHLRHLGHIVVALLETEARKTQR
mmetsp:Transcript_24273/g.61412  ORF Transcript_24273/g.61412 Transcript_24273/m.61412 type:complete len:302 (-) Transcript_24273:633-1538(-)